MILTISQGIRLVTEQQAAERLLADGFMQAQCEACGGTKFFEPSAGHRTICSNCEGFGWVWQQPPAKFS